MLDLVKNNNAQERQDFTLGNPLGEENPEKILSRIMFKIEYNAKDQPKFIRA